MPEASSELREEWGIMDSIAIQYLEGNGYVLTSDWTWVTPPNHVPTSKECRAIQFLIDEWDFGGFEDREMAS